jgi:hypothetical protein
MFKNQVCTIATLNTPPSPPHLLMPEHGLGGLAPVERRKDGGNVSRNPLAPHSDYRAHAPLASLWRDEQRQVGGQQPQTAGTVQYLR